MSGIGGNGGPPMSCSTQLDRDTDLGAAAIYGSMMGLEAHWEGDMAVTGMTIDKAIGLFLSDVYAVAGPMVASAYALRFQKSLQHYSNGGSSENQRA